MGAVLIEEDLLYKQRIIDKDLPEGRSIHDFLLSRAKVLAGKYIDFDKTPAIFLFSESEEPNAFFAPVSEYQDRPKLDRSSDSRQDSVVYTPNPYEIPIICVNRGLIDMVDNLDQLDYVLAHELTHFIIRNYGINGNSKGEEEIADLHAIDLMYDAGGDPKQALIMAEKINVYVEKKKAENREHGRNASEEGLNWSEIFNVHMTHSNRKSAIEASLTRISHLIDERTPTDIDKTVFNADYDDPIDAHLRDIDYAEKEPLEKLKALIDMVDIFSEDALDEEGIREQIDELGFDTPEGFVSENKLKILKLKQRRSDLWYSKGYFSGKIIEPKYKQKIAWLSEEVFNDLYREQIEQNKLKPKDDDEREFYPEDKLDTAPAIIYLQDKAYDHIKKHGYPDHGDMNYHDASSMLYSYFYNFLMSKMPRDREEEYEDSAPASKPKIIDDINAVKLKIRNAQTKKELRKAIKKFKFLNKILNDIEELNDNERGGYHNKLENLSLFSRHSRFSFGMSYEAQRIYSQEDRKPNGSVVAWNNPVEIAKDGKKAKKLATQILKDHGIHDYRLTHDLPYVTMGDTSYKINENGVLLPEKIERYELEFALHQDDVLAAYEYIKLYFEHENRYIQNICDQACNLTDNSFDERKIDDDGYPSRLSNGEEANYALVEAFNSLPSDRDFSNRHVLSAIPSSYRRSKKMPACHENGRLKIETDLFEYTNPIFQKYFGENFQETVQAQKQEQQEKLFETAFEVIKQLPNEWLKASQKYETSNKKFTDFQNKFEDQTLTGEQRKKCDALRQEVYIDKELKRSIYSVIVAYTFGIFENGHGRSDNITKLTPEQKNQIAEYIVQDKNNVFTRIFESNQYERFCDFFDVLTGQIGRVVSGDQSLTPMMQIVANNIGYKRSDTREDIEKFVKNANKSEDLNAGRYAWYLNAFDTLRYLSKSSQIDIAVLKTSLNKIKVKQSDGFGRRSDDKDYAAYKSLLTSNSVLANLSKAIDNDNNYHNLSFKQNITAIDDLIVIQRQMKSLLEKDEEEKDWREKIRWDYNLSKSQKHVRYVRGYLTETFQKAVNSFGVYTPEQKKDMRNEAFLNTINNKTNERLSESINQILDIENPLKKMKRLYWFYNAEKESFSSDKHRTNALDEFSKENKILENICKLSLDDKFWPEDPFEHIEAFLFAKHTFIDDVELEDTLIKKILDKVELQKPGKAKNKCLYTLLDKQLRAPSPETRQRLFDIYSKDLFDKIGLDDKSDKYSNRLDLYLRAIEGESENYRYSSKKRSYKDFLSHKMSSADKYVFLRQISETVVSQEKTSEMFKKACQISLDAESLQRSYLYGIGVDGLTSRLDKEPETSNKFVQFFNSNGELENCEAISNHIKNSIRADYESRNGKPITPEDIEYLESQMKGTDPANCKILYDNFWSAPLEARAVIIARMLKSAVAEQDNEETNATPKDQQSWERVFDVVMDNLIAPDDTSTEAQYSRETMHSYIKAKSDYERELILSAMMVANRNLGEDTGNIGKGLRFLLENSGPAEIKAGQAGGSHPNTPEKIGAELQELKNNANTPARWTVYDWIKDENIPEEYWKDQHLGQIRAASYYATIELGDDEILRLLVPEAREKAKKGFRVLGDTIEDLKEKDAVSDLDFGELTTSVQQMITQASKMSDIETDHEIGAQQCVDVKEICDGVKITSGAQTFDVKVMDWKVKGKNWIVMQRAKGPVFNELPTTTPQEVAYKKDFAKGYIPFQIGNILSGGKFDHDTHGANLCVDPQTNIAGLFDTGAMALNAPTQEEQRLLGHVLYDAIKMTLSGEKSFTVFSRSISDKIDELHDQGTDTKYLVEVKKEILALGDFFKVLDQSDVKEIMPDLNILNDVAEPIRDGIFERMSEFEKTQLKMLSAANAFKQNNSAVVIDRSNTGASTKQNVVDVNIAPTVKDKAAWLDQTFAVTKTQTGKSKPSALIKLCA